MVTPPLLISLVLLAAKPLSPHADAREIKSLLHELPEPSNYFYPDLSGFPPESKNMLRSSAEAAIAQVRKDTGLERQDAIDLLAAAILPTFDIDDARVHRNNERRRALLESVLSHKPDSEIPADVFGHAVATRDCALTKRADRHAALRRLPEGLDEYWIGIDYAYDGHNAEAESHFALAASGSRRTDRARFDHARMACKLGHYDVCLRQIEATEHDEQVDRKSGVIGQMLESRRVWWRAKALAGLGLFDEARASFRTALGRAEPLLDPQATVSDKDKEAIRRHDDVSLVICEIGKTYAREKKWEEAETLLARGFCDQDLGKAYYDQGKNFDAIVAWQGAHVVDDERVPEHILAFARLGAVGDAMTHLSYAAKACEMPVLDTTEEEHGFYRPRPSYCDGLASVRDQVLNAKAKASAQEAAGPAPHAVTIKNAATGADTRSSSGAVAGGGAKATTSKSLVIKRLSAPKLAAWRETTLPRGFKPIPLLKPPKSLKSRSVVFAAIEGDRALAVTVSGDLDPRGEVSRGGYWAHLSDDGGKSFRSPLYLGFAEGYPYVVEEHPRVSPFHGQTLRLDVRRREIDDTKITFPPNPQIRVRRDDIVIEVPIADLVRDSDEDGLTDLFEEKIATDLHAADTDGDGLGDAEDPQPLTPRQTVLPPEDEVLGSALVGILFEHVPALYVDADAGGSLTALMGHKDTAAEGIEGISLERTLFVRSERPILSALATSMRVIVLSPEELTAYSAKFGFTAPLDISVIFDPAGNRALVIYNFQWRGGAYLATKQEGRWKVQPVESWIT